MWTIPYALLFGATWISASPKRNNANPAGAERQHARRGHDAERQAERRREQPMSLNTDKLNGLPMSPFAPADGSARTEDLAMLIRRLCRVVAKHDANNTVRAQALDYLHRKGLGGSPLKEQAPNNRV